jgi:hypothetical protein
MNKNEKLKVIKRAEFFIYQSALLLSASVVSLTCTFCNSGEHSSVITTKSKKQNCIGVRNN